MDVLKIATAGSVDDGKSTLIGRILYDTKSLTSDKLEAIEKTSKSKGYDYLDFSLATDGLVAEREQGITIDVAHIYFSTAKKSYIIADTPGHVEYTRNMVTGASTSQAAIILIDARKGVIEQTNRHFFINNLLRIKDVVVAINKMDLVDYSEETYNAIKADFEELMAKRDYQDQKITFIPVSALKGDNVVNKTDKTPWYTGPTLLEHFEALDRKDIFNVGTPRFPVQYVIRPKTEEHHDFRGFAGKVYGGELSVGDEVVALPSQTRSKIKDIYFYDKKYHTASRRSSVTITLEDEINLSRGDMLVKAEDLPTIDKQFTATISWMDSDNLTAGKKYVVQHGVNKVLAKVDNIHHKINPDYSGIDTNVDGGLGMNDIAQVTFKLNKPIFYDKFKDHRTNGSFILIDTQTNNTVGAGFIS
ncbi:GTP-binding protein [Zobellia galactanivorans]|uniref:sulfate adenylyltransferase n=1 Tax=Zobellia galactanivorans (strain DSM 12802 / CCUG 47099 / CIP 106680 / NCIMB 13871 / Dsij) TaxID=63186 RepID=G0L9X7_ZOBGA|nr:MULTISPECIES: GTP-binding protein [Zobellia]MBU3027472.1 50S ribosome-binding GTPase [Zobellia galactanivorans]MDO6519127.1 GTP-binding protein [Zobellia uliginosa]MDO6809427.1 GTP-binding protein [Zobellia galactanivorans]OWW24314.1 sulfate adenylyltransferase [Zobellia sp. OII3]CAZ94907.1 Sulfate adenylyltransferase subunit 1 [Zobellia galactanivorans]